MDSTCSTCGGTGFEIQPRSDGTSAAIRCACQQAQRGRRLLRAARIPRRYEHCTVDGFETHNPSHKAALSIARDWIERWPLVEQGLLFLGGPGTGKTHLAVGIARELAEHKSAHVRFQEQRELLKMLQGTYATESSTSETEVLSAVVGAEVLILDDLGAGRVTAWTRDVLHDVIVHRYNQKLPLIMTSNLPTGEDDGAGGAPAERVTLRDRLGDALMSRIYEMCLTVPFEGNDYRREILHARHRF